jgi:hypothetical protein
VRTAREFFDLMNPAQAQGFQRFSQMFGGTGQAPGQPPVQGQGQGQGQAPGQGQYSGQPQPPGQPQSSSQGGFSGQGQAPGQGQGPDQGQAVGHGGFLQGSFFGQQQEAGQGQAPAQDPSSAAGQAQGQAQPAAPGQFPGQGQPAAPGQNPNQGQSPAQGPFPGQGQAPNQGRNRNDDDYDHYSADNSGLRGFRNRSRRGFDIFHPVDSIVDEVGDAVGGAVADAALGFIGRRVKKAFEEKLMPAMQGMQQQAGQQQTEQDAIAARYPELRACTRDQVIFLVGGYQTIPVSELRQPVTLAQADALVARLR